MPCNTKEKQRISAAKHYIKNKPAMKLRARLADAERKVRCQSWIKDYLSIHPCVDCGEGNIIVLDFDHKDRSLKEDNVSVLAGGKYSMKRLISEVDKCDIRCANCHRKKTYAESGWKHRG